MSVWKQQEILIAVFTPQNELNQSGKSTFPMANPRDHSKFGLALCESNLLISRFLTTIYHKYRVDSMVRSPNISYIAVLKS